jgi:cell division protein FtsL
MAITLKSREALIQVRDQTIEGWTDMRQERQELEDSWRRCIYAYLCIFDKKWAEYARQAGRSCRYVSLSKDAVDTLLPQIYDAMLGQENWLKIVPERQGFSEEDQKFAEYQTHLLMYQNRQTDFSRTAKLAIKSLLMVGNCPVSESWYTRKIVDYSTVTDEMERWSEDFAKYHLEHKALKDEYRKTVLQLQALGQNEFPPPPQFKEPPRPPVKTDIAFAGPRTSIGSIFNYVQEQHPNDEREAIRIMRSWRTKAYLKEMAKENEDGYRLYQNIGAIEEIDSEATSKDNEAEKLFKMALGMEMPHGKDKVELKERHGTFEIKSGPEAGIYHNYISVVANDNAVIRCEPSPFYSGRPLIWNARIGITAGSVYGMGPIEKGLDEQDSANAIHNQKVDAVNSAIQPEYEVVQDNLVDGVMKPSGPGAKHYVTEKGSITPIVKNFQGIPLGFEELSAAIARHERITGAVNTATGADETATRTARNSNIIATKLGGHVTDIEEEFLNVCMNTKLEMNAQYMTTDQVIAIVKDKTIQEITITPSQVRRGYVAHATGSKYLAEKQEKLQNLMMAVQLATQSPDGRPMPIKMEELYKLLFTEILGEAGNLVMSSDEYRQAIAEFEQKQQMMMAMEQAQRSQGGNAGPGGQQGPAGFPQAV